MGLLRLFRLLIKENENSEFKLASLHLNMHHTFPLQKDLDT